MGSCETAAGSPLGRHVDTRVPRIANMLIISKKKRRENGKKQLSEDFLGSRTTSAEAETVHSALKEKKKKSTLQRSHTKIL